MNMEMELCKRIIECATAYYSGEPIISDDEFDRLVDLLREMNPNNPILTKVGWGYSPEVSPLTKRPHHYGDMVGLPKHKVTPDSVIDLEGRVASPKLDGLSLEIYYKHGVLCEVLTRGNGKVGLDVTDKVKHLIPAVLPSRLTMSVRGEFVLSYENFNKYYSDSPSPRNVASGVLNRLSYDKSEIHRFSVVTYRILGITDEVGMDGNGLYDRVSHHELLTKLGFEVAPVLTGGSHTYEEIFMTLNDMSPRKYPLDGVVCDDSEVKLVINEMDYIVEYQNSVAYKIVTDSVVVDVTGVEFNLTRTGRIVPTVFYSPVQLSGATLQKATGHNCKYIEDNRIGRGSKVEIVRSGEVIPYIVGVEEPSEESDLLPTNCPSCSHPLEWSGKDLKCTNKECSSKSYIKISHWIWNVGNVHGMGGSLVDTIINELNIESVIELYTLNLSVLDNACISGIGSSKLELIKKVFSTLRGELDLANVLVGLNIDGLSWKSANNLVSQELYNYLMNRDFESCSMYIESRKGVMKKSKQVLISELSYLFELLDYIKIASVEVITDTTASSELLPVCITGKLVLFSKRKEIFEKYADKIIEVDVKKCKYLVCNQDKNSSKMKYAKANNIPVITEQQLVDLLS